MPRGLATVPGPADRHGGSYGKFQPTDVGRSVAGHLATICITRIARLVDQDPSSCTSGCSPPRVNSTDPCLLNTVMSAVDRAEGRPARFWWHYTPERKRLQARRTA
ncbi:helix-hairpin-helix domain-containing protein [Streptomyces niveus]|uniref:helix-hairpin-helix domain-containing protein n=1 Tax=Streptomyces niveus TaxID=193462 RepID=UPI0036D3A469